jgi:hypothetical protein
MEMYLDSKMLFHPVSTHPINTDCTADTLYRDAMERNITSLPYQYTRNLTVTVVFTRVTKCPRISGTNPASEVQYKFLEWVIIHLYYNRNHDVWHLSNTMN